MDRNQMLAAADSSEIWDMLVIGGGATGLGAALDAVSRGYRTILLEGQDFAHGTSSRSTKLIHGGVRYLRQGQIGMVRHSLRERALLLRNAPHLVHPLNFVIPAYRRGSAFYYYAGLCAYDLLGASRSMDRTRLLSRTETLKKHPTLRTQNLRGGVSYNDGQFDDARLAICLAQTLADHGATVINYMPVRRLLRDGSRTAGVVAVDLETDREYSVRAKAVINATGVFTDSILQLDNDENAPRNAIYEPAVIPSQGSHLVLDRAFLPSDSALMIPETDDGRVLFAIPWHGRILFGTTDIEVPSVAAEPRPLQQEIDYLLRYAARYLTHAPTEKDVLSMFSGLRPLVRSGNSGRSTAGISREHEIRTSPSGLISVIGGKWTTYRQMGEDVVNLAEQVAGLSRQPSVTHELRLHGSSEEAGDDANDDDGSPGTFEREFRRVYGTDNAAIGHLAVQDPELQNRLHPRLPFSMAQVVWAVQHEMARTVDDVLARRLRALFLDARAAIAAAPAVAELMMRQLQRDSEWKDKQLRKFETLARGYYIQEAAEQ